MIKKGKIRCLRGECNNKPEFDADLIKYRVMFQGRIVGVVNNNAVAQHSSSPRPQTSPNISFGFDDDDDEDNLTAPSGPVDELESAVENLGADESDYSFGGATETLFVTVRELIENGGSKTYDGGNVTVRLVENRCVNPHSLNDPEHPERKYFEEVCFGVRVLDKPERYTRHTLDHRFCPYCEQESGIAAGMGFQDNYLVMLFGETTSGKTTWLNTIYRDLIENVVSGWRIMSPGGRDGKHIEEEVLPVDELGNPKATEVTDQDKLCALFSFHNISNDREIGIVFRDIAGELARYNPSSADAETISKAQLYFNAAQSFANIADGMLVFRDIFSIEKIADSYATVPREFQQNITLSDYQGRIRNMLEQADVDINKCSFEGRNIIDPLRRLALPVDRPFALMYVLNKSDVMKAIVNEPIKTDMDEIVPFDFRSNNPETFCVLNTSASSMWDPVSHNNNFDYKNYLRCAIETAGFASSQDSTLWDVLTGKINQTNYMRGVTVITSKAKNMKKAANGRTLEPLAWLLEVFGNEHGEFFRKTLARQYADRKIL